VIEEVWAEFEKKFGRKYNAVEGYCTDDADTILVGQGSMTETARGAIDAFREQGKKVGLLRIRLWRPFPFEDVRKALGNAKTAIIFDRCLSTGGIGGPLAGEIKSALYNATDRPDIVSFIGGLGGRDVRIKDFIELIEKGESYAASGNIPDYELVGVRS
jgi:pyruvate ferredoxin oxidoreductase alpha subunit